MSRLFGWLPQARWKRWLVFIATTGFLFLLLVITIGVTAFLLWRNPQVQTWVMVKMLGHEARQPADIPSKPFLSTEERVVLSTNASALQSAADLFRPTNVWDVQLKFTSNQWTKLGPNTVRPVLHLMQPDGSIILRNPAASRNGLAGVFGLDFPWSEADLNFGDLQFQSVGARFKGNGTFVNSQRSYKRPFKINLSRNVATQQLAGRTTLNFHNLVADASCLSDTMAYEFFRDADVPVSRTAFARLRLTVKGRFDDRLLGLYVVVENPDEDWAREQFGVEGIVLFKPVTYELFKDLGDDWKTYAGIYDAKMKVKSKQTGRLIALAKLVTHATDMEFAARVGDFIDLDEFARFLACQVILSNYDGILSNGQNFLLYLDPRTERFGFIPWDLDHCWGEFPFIGSIKQREQASLWHPWVGENHFLDRMLAAPPVKERYRRELERIRSTLFLPDLLGRRLDELTRVVRPFVSEESSLRLARFERENADYLSKSATGEAPSSARPRGFSLKHFFAARAISVSQQLAGDAEGTILSRRSSR
jgi:spore coat protein H